jgi:hypothetical protein
MIPEFTSLPFLILDVYEGFAVAKGLMRVNENTLTLEFEIKDNFLGLFKSGVKEVRISIDEIDSVTLKKGWFKIAFIIRTQKLSSLGKLPKQDHGQIRLNLLREDRKTAESVVSFLMLRISEKKLKLLDVNDTEAE